MDKTTYKTTSKNPSEKSSSSHSRRLRSVPVELSPELLESLSRGDTDAFSRIYLHYRKPLVDFLYFLIHNWQEAEEIAQDVFASLWENRTRITDIKNFKSYLYQAAKYGAYDLMEKQKVAERYIEFRKNNFTDLGNDPEEIYRGEEIELLMKISVANMPETQRTVFGLKHEKGLTNTEIAQRLGITKRAVEAHLYRAKQSIERLLALFAFLFISQ